MPSVKHGGAQTPPPASRSNLPQTPAPSSRVAGHPQSGDEPTFGGLPLSSWLKLTEDRDFARKRKGGIQQ